MSIKRTTAAYSAGAALLVGGILIGVAPLAHAETMLSIDTEARGFDGGEGESSQVITVGLKYNCAADSGISKIGVTATQSPFDGKATGKGNLGKLNCDGKLHSELVDVRSSTDWNVDKAARITASFTNAENQTAGSAKVSKDVTIFVCGSTSC
ncbi:hypothetical protein [Nocardia sp. NPDC050175]|uniref:hypothetical protein n=1 Tax=Nocardia sp. NPDC050175 TaxID=3364317 RepID=UPI0037AD917F